MQELLLPQKCLNFSSFVYRDKGKLKIGASTSCERSRLSNTIYHELGKYTEKGREKERTNDVPKGHWSHDSRRVLNRELPPFLNFSAKTEGIEGATSFTRSTFISGETGLPGTQIAKIVKIENIHFAQ